MVDNIVKGKHHEICEILRWEDEGGADLGRHRFVSRDSRNVTASLRAESVSDMPSEMSPLEKLVDEAQVSLSNQNYDKALEEYKAAAQRFQDYKSLVNHSVDNGIKALTTMGCAATPPHPKALELVRLRDQLLTK